MPLSLFAVITAAAGGLLLLTLEPVSSNLARLLERPASCLLQLLSPALTAQQVTSQLMQLLSAPLLLLCRLLDVDMVLLEQDFIGEH